MNAVRCVAATFPVEPSAPILTNPPKACERLAAPSGSRFGLVGFGSDRADLDESADASDTTPPTESSIGPRHGSAGNELGRAESQAGRNPRMARGAQGSQWAEY